MIPTRQSPATTPSDEGAKRLLRMMRPRGREGNKSWLQRSGFSEGVLLFGGAGLADFRIRVAQSLLRGDLRPSYWSLAGLWFGGQRFVSAPLGTQDPSAVPGENGVRDCDLGDYDDPDRYPNIAVVQFSKSLVPLRRAMESIRRQRGIIDLPSLIVPWLGFVWGAADATNPLLAGKGLPSAAFVEAAFALTGLDVTPGVASSATCPEAIWHAVKWWRPFYEEASKTYAAAGKSPSSALQVIAPVGRLTLRQMNAAISWPAKGTRRRAAR